MAVHIRLARAGAKKRPFYRLVVADQRSPRGGRFLETIGTFDPRKDEGIFAVDRARLDYWRANGAQPTETVLKLIKRHVAAQDAAAVEPK